MTNTLHISLALGRFLAVSITVVCTSASSMMAEEDAKPSISGIYPHLAYWNDEGECGTGAVVPWADRLWVITYAPHRPEGSTDKLYEIDNDLNIVDFEGSVGGTPANRFIHRETNQLVIGPYVIDGERNIRVIPQSKMYGRLTGNARHLFEPEKKIYYATMEEGVYEVDLRTLEVVELFRDYQGGTGWGGRPEGSRSDLPLTNTPGYHGKGLYSGQGRLIYANNGEASRAAQQRPDVPSGCLAEWDGLSKTWNVIRRNQFTDIRGPGGLYGNPDPEADPVWAIGWDHRSLLLMLLDGGTWYTYRLPKATHTYDGAHGWNTEWPRFNDLGEPEMVMNMHGMFWRFPRTFSRANSAGIRPRSTYLKVVGDYCKWNDKLVFGCDDTAKNEFLNKRRAKGNLRPPGQSHSNLWFTDLSILDHLGTPLGRGAVWANEDIAANTPSDPYLFHGFERRGIHLAHQSAQLVDFTVEVDLDGNNQWTELTKLTVPPNSAIWHSFDSTQEGTWIRLSANRDCISASAQFQYSNPDKRTLERSKIFKGLATAESGSVNGGIVYVRGDGRKTLGYCATQVADGKEVDRGFYELDEGMNLNVIHDLEAETWALTHHEVKNGTIEMLPASAVYTDDKGQRWHLPRGNGSFDRYGPLGAERVDREVVTERDLFNCHGTFYELPARNAGGFAKIRPICTHNLRIKDYCSYRGLLILTGVDANAPSDNPHIIRSDDGKVALWAGVVDDLWKLGRPVGLGGPWHKTRVEADVPSEPYLMTGYENKSVKLVQFSGEEVTVTLQVDIDGGGTWVDYKSFDVSPQESIRHAFPEDFSAYWIRAVSNKDAIMSAVFSYQ